MDRFSASDYLASVRYYDENLRLLDDTLRHLCREHPDHIRPSSVHAKLWIIARTYATGLERKVATRGTQGSSLSQVATKFLANGRRLDELIGELNAVAEPLSAEKLKTIVRLHGTMVNMFTPVIRRGQSVRAFVSKYLHFHNSVVLIYDSLATDILRRLVPWTRELETFSMPVRADKTYAWHTMRFLTLYGFVRAAHLTLNVKYLDHYLIWLADKRIQHSRK